MTYRYRYRYRIENTGTTPSIRATPHWPRPRQQQARAYPEIGKDGGMKGYVDGLVPFAYEVWGYKKIEQ